tara:strand:+ start:1494 stop:1622 length:129 start_codon:yes stop_codon:yes gene_type:complete
MSSQRAKDLFLLAFWSVAYLLKTVVEIPWLWIKKLFNKNDLT